MGFRDLFRRATADEPSQQQEKRTLTTENMHWPIAANLADPTAVTPEGANRLAAVFACVRLLSTSIAQLPLVCYQQQGDGRAKIPTPALFEHPSATGTAHDWILRAVTSIAYHGNAVGLIVARDEMERYPTQIEWLDPRDVYVEDQLMFGPGSFTDPIWSWRGQRIPTADIVHIPWVVVPNRVWGLSPMAAYALSVSSGLSAQRFADDWYKSGGTPPGIMRNENQAVSQQEAQIIKQRTVQALRSHEPLVFGNDWTYEPLTVNPAEAQFIEVQRLNATQIATVYGVPPEMVGGDTGRSMTYQNVEQQSINFVQFTILPWVTKIEQVLSLLLPKGQFVKFDVDALIRTDIETRFSVYERGRMIGVLSVNEIRAMEDRAPIDGGDDFEPLPVQAGKPVSLPQIRSNGPGDGHESRGEADDESER